MSAVEQVSPAAGTMRSTLQGAKAKEGGGTRIPTPHRTNHCRSPTPFAVRGRSGGRGRAGLARSPPIDEALSAAKAEKI